MTNEQHKFFLLLFKKIGRKGLYLSADKLSQYFILKNDNDKHRLFDYFKEKVSERDQDALLKLVGSKENWKEFLSVPKIQNYISNEVDEIAKLRIKQFIVNPDSLNDKGSLDQLKILLAQTKEVLDKNSGKYTVSYIHCPTYKTKWNDNSLKRLNGLLLKIEQDED